MSTYITSDLHGDYYNFIKLLETIKFDSKTDKLYILGDVLDRGKYGIKLLNFIRKYIDEGSMVLIKGNHELFAEMYLKINLTQRKWSTWGGGPTLEEIYVMSKEEKDDLLRFIESLEHYISIKASNSEWVLTHAGISADYLKENEDGTINVKKSIDYAVCEDEFMLLVSNDIHYVPHSIVKKLDCFVVVGHTPVIGLNDDGSYKILKKDNYMCIDTGAGHRNNGGRMSAIRIEDMKEFYI